MNVSEFDFLLDTVQGDGYSRDSSLKIDDLSSPRPRRRWTRRGDCVPLKWLLWKMVAQKICHSAKRTHRFSDAF